MHPFKYTTIDEKKMKDSTCLAFPKKAFDHKTESHFDPFKRFAIELSDVCSADVKRVEEKRAANRQGLIFPY